MSADGGVEARISVRAKPGARRSRVAAVREGTYDISIAAPPVDGAANAELVRYLAKLLGVPKRDVRVARGTSSRNKLVVVSGVEAQAVRERLETAIGEGRQQR